MTVVAARPLAGVRVIAALCALSSLGALITHVLGWLPMVYFLSFFGVPSVILLLALAAWSRRIDAPTFVTALVVGVGGGFVATLAYDVFRWVLRSAGIFQYDGFRAIYIFGSWISGQPLTSREAAIAGWFYHFWNGVSFGAFYTLAFGRGTVWKGTAYGLFMEACMLGLFPAFIRITNQVDFIGLSMLGHLVYGATLGWIAQRYGRDWPPLGARREPAPESA